MSHQKLHHFILLCIALIPMISFAQYRGNHWVFGDSTGINFNTIPPTLDTTRIISTLEPSASISDENGNLLFYVGSASALNNISPGWWKYIVRNSQDSIMQNGDSLGGSSTITQGVLILPFPNDTNLYYIFHIYYKQSPPPRLNLMYSIVDMSQNNGLGAIISSNNLVNDTVSEKLYAVKAANGKDWWLINPGWNSYVYKIDSTGIHLGPVPGLTGFEGSGQLIFNLNGDKFISAGSYEITKLHDFDRCTGVISNTIILDSCPSQSKIRYGCSFSPSGRFLYLSSEDSLWQFDLNAPNVVTSRQLIYAAPYTGSTLLNRIGQHMLAPNGKIYIANHYPFVINSYNTSLSIINNPDLIGVSCNYCANCFSLNGHRSFYNLPNMPNYYLGQLENVNCDSILATNDEELKKEIKVEVFPNPTTSKLYIKPRQDIGITLFALFDYTGKEVFKSNEKEIDISELPSGLYIYQILTRDQGIFSGKVVKE